MGRIFETRKTTMFARWNKMAKAFTRVSREIMMAAKAGGPDPAGNASLRRAIANARALNMPKDKIEAAIKRAHGKDATDYNEVIYEGYGPHGIPILVVAATDNIARTVANIRVHFSRSGGSLGQSGSVAYGFARMGVFRILAEGADRDTLELALIDHGLEDIGEGKSDKDEALLILRSDIKAFGTMQQALEDMGIATVSSGSEFVPETVVELDDDKATEVLALIDRLEQDDDVQDVFHNLV